MTTESFMGENGDFPEATTPSWLAPAGLRPPDWRWQLARLLLEKELRRRLHLKDEWVQRCVKFMRADHVQSTSCRPRRGLSSDHVLSEAARIRFASDPLIAAELEAWTLTGEPRPFVAEITGGNELVIEAYEFAFFDVRSRLEATSYIMHTVIGPGFYEGFRLDDLAPIWKMVGYFRGRYSLATALQAFPGSRIRPWPDWYKASPEEQARLIKACRGAVLVRCLSRDLSSVRDLKQIMELLSVLEAKREERSRPLGVAFPLLSSEDMSPAIEVVEREEPFPNQAQSLEVTIVATVQQTA